jgi:hypothetical protein
MHWDGREDEREDEVELRGECQSRSGRDFGPRKPYLGRHKTKYRHRQQ